MQIYRAVITNNKDPLFQNRYQVRIFGLVDGTTSGFEATSNDDLPWAECMGSTSFGLIGGVGVSSVLHQGTWVYVILQDNNPNKPIIMGTVTGNAVKNQDGFGDPDGKFPIEEGPDMGVSGDKYTNCQMIKTSSGHIIEFDDSNGDARIHIHHSSGSDILIDNTGNIKILGVQNADYQIQGNLTFTVQGTTTIDCATTHITGDVNIDGTSTARGDHVSAGISGKGHTHTGVHGETSGPH